MAVYCVRAGFLAPPAKTRGFGMTQTWSRWSIVADCWGWGNGVQVDGMANVAYLSLGSNLGDRGEQLRLAISRLASHGRVLSVSSFYETEPVEVSDQPWFLNCAVALETSEPPSQLMSSLLAIERGMGRERIREKGPRTVDIDILLYGDRVVNTEELTVPHPAMARRRFVLEPLAEIAGEVRHPVVGKTVHELLAELPAGQSVRRVEAREE
ncbi:MAG TPA: 2-amino-4-hydroxy-6-hydroxymethyldihydropteridine diphosphokinase [Candidatus Sulfotelmatobacter sp.]|nr:2-amino-4-hydroxy-6-hydroxymethyldihydropteridine diphosphokinase [Candidatus Sulfotelmatobacter sp.]